MIVSLGVRRPDIWTHFTIGCTAAVALTLTLPRLYAANPAARA